MFAHTFSAPHFVILWQLAVIGLLFFIPHLAQGQIVFTCPSQCSSSQEIIGCDNRVQGPTSIAAALDSSKPWRHVGRLDNGSGGLGCTGTLISPNHVLTAAHCVLNSSNNFHNSSIRFRLAQFNLGPCSRPYGDRYAVRVFVPNDYDNSSIAPTNKALDWAVIELANPIPGAARMSYGYLSWNTIRNKTPFTIGYPFDKGNSTVWHTGDSNDFLVSPDAWISGGKKGLLYVTNDGAAGQSGSPLYVFHNGARKLVGVFIGSPPSHCRAGRNWAARLTPGTVSRITNATFFPPNGNVLDSTLRRREIPPNQVPTDVPPANCGN